MFNFVKYAIEPRVRSTHRIIAPLGLILSGMFLGGVASAGERISFGLGHTPSPELVANWDIAIGPNGAELPHGSGTVPAGRKLYAERCATCHGANGTEGPDPVLVGGHGSLNSAQPQSTIGSYWAYATTLYDYIFRAMPFVAPGSLSADEVYALCAFLLNANGFISQDAVMDRMSLPAVRMPNRDGFSSIPGRKNSAERKS
jgi:mono/diheme cytochrome c family protein